MAPFTSWAEAATNIQAAVDAAGIGDIVLVTNGTYSPFVGFETRFMTTSNAPAPVVVTASGFLGAGNEGWRAFTRNAYWALPTGTSPQWVTYDSGLPGGLQINSYQMICPNRTTGDQGLSMWEIQVSQNGTDWVPVDVRSENLTENVHYYFQTAQPATCRYVRVYVTGVRDPVYGGTLRIAFGHSLVVTSVNGAAATTIDAGGQSGVWLGTAQLNGFRIVGATNYGVFQGDVRNCRVFGIHGVGISSARNVEGCTVANGTEYGVVNVAILRNSVIENNQASGVFNCGIIEGCVIRGNGSLAANGGGIFMQGLVGGASSISGCYIISNKALNGGGIYMTSGTVQNCFISGNIANGRGGGLWYQYGTAGNCTIVGNTAVQFGGGTDWVYLRNSIVYGNRGSDGYSNYVGGGFFYSCTMPAPGGEGNKAVEPGLFSLSSPRLTSSSPCIDAGSLEYAVGDWDVEGEPRIWGMGVDIGCDEFYPPGLTGPLSVALRADFDRAVVGFPVRFRHVVEGKAEGYRLAFGDGRGVSNLMTIVYAYSNAGTYNAILTAWNAEGSASATTTVQIFSGYTNYVSPSGGHLAPYTNWSTAATTIQAAVAANIPGGVVVVGDGVYHQGGAVVTGNLLNRVALTNGVSVRSVNGPASTIIMGQGPLGETAVRCAYVGSGSRLEGFTLTNGHTRAGEGLAEDQIHGAAVQVQGNGMVSNCIITGSRAYGRGGGAWGGKIVNSVLSGNAAAEGGGAYGSLLENCVIRANTVSSNGGGAYGGTIRNCLVFDNTARSGGGTAASTNNHCTIARNTAAVLGGGIYRSVARNSIIYHNSDSGGWPEFFNSICTYTCTRPDPAGTGCLTNDPQFVNVTGGDFHTRRSSPCLDAALGGDSPPFAFDGMPRPLDGDGDGVAAPDMGAYEFSGVHYVAPGGGHVWPYITWADAARDIQSAVDVADVEDWVVVSNGFYATGGRVVAGGLTNRVVVDKAILVQSVGGPTSTVIAGKGPIGDAAVRGVYLGSNACLSGFTVRDGATRAIGDEHAARSGGGIWCESGATVSNSLIMNCVAQANGGGVFAGRLVNCFVHNNRAARGGGVASGRLEFSTVTGNHADQGGGVYEGTGSHSIVYFNEAESGPNVFGGTWTICCVTPDPGGTGHITLDPLLSAINDYRLTQNSPCIDVAPAAPSFPARDLDGIPRPLDGDGNLVVGFDLGASEFVSDLSDADGDGLSDFYELQVAGTDLFLWDTDGDTQSDGEEVVAGVSPLDPTHFFAITQAVSLEEDPEPRFYWPGVAGRLYTILTMEAPGREMMALPSYVDQPGYNGLMAFTNEAPAERGCYAVRVRMAP